MSNTTAENEMITVKSVDVYEWIKNEDYVAINRVAAIAIVLLECIRTIPPEIRIIRRIMRRGGRLNISEWLFFGLKYIGLLAALSHGAMQYSRHWLTAQDCLALNYLFEVCEWIAVILVTITLALRCYIIFERSKKVAALLLFGIVLQAVPSIVWACRSMHYHAIYDGFCDYDPEELDEFPGISMFLTVFWLGSACAVDFLMVVSSSIRLLRNSPNKWYNLHKTSLLLFQHNVHYVFTVTVANFALAIMYPMLNVPPLFSTVASIQIVIGMQQIIAEQDSVHGYQRAPIAGGAGISNDDCCRVTPRSSGGGPRAGSGGVSASPSGRQYGSAKLGMLEKIKRHRRATEGLPPRARSSSSLSTWIRIPSALSPKKFARGFSLGSKESKTPTAAEEASSSSSKACPDEKDLERAGGDGVLRNAENRLSDSMLSAPASKVGSSEQICLVSPNRSSRVASCSSATQVYRSASRTCIGSEGTEADHQGKVPDILETSPVTSLLPEGERETETLRDGGGQEMEKH